MTTPISDFVKSYVEGEVLRLHMPGHKGEALLGVEALDITEIEGADVLYSPTGIIAESEKNAAELFESGKTVYSTEGSSLSIRAMLYLALLWGRENGKDSTVLAGRNAHRVFHSAAALLDLDVEWLYGDGDTLTSCKITPEALDEALKRIERKPFAVYLTSPDYLGNILDMVGLAEVARRHGILCLVDNAHGAYLNFLEESKHPISLGAHICADSAHKTLPALTGAGYLHISRDAPSIIFEEADGAMALFASTSPSYLTLQSLDEVNKYLSEGYAKALQSFCEEISSLKAELRAHGYSFIGDEPLKLTIDAKAYGYSGEEIAELLRKSGIVCEHADRDALVLMLTPETGKEGLDRLCEALLSIGKKEALCQRPPKQPRLCSAISAREAIMSRREKISAKDSLGRVLADATVSCPPAIPIAALGEIIDENAIELFEYYGIDTVTVVK